MNETKAKVAYILTPITFGGADKVSLNFLRGVRRAVFDIQPILLVRPWEPRPFLAEEVERMGYAYRTLPVSLKQGADRFRVVRVAARLYSLLKSGGFDLVHSHGYFADICGLPAARLLGIRSVSTCHGYIAGDGRLRFYNYLDRQSLKLASAVVAVSDGIAEELIRSGVKESKLSVIPNAVAITHDDGALGALRDQKRESLGIGETELVIGYLGRLSAEKGCRFLIDAVHKLLGELPVKLLIVGDGPEQPRLEELVESLGLSDRVAFAGFQTDPEGWLPAFDVFVLPSLTEGTPVALLEAMAARVPVVATNVGGVPQLITDGTTGLLVPAGDPWSLSVAIGTLIRDPDLMRRVAAAGFETVRTRYGLDSWCRRLEEQYCSLLAAGAS